MTGHQDKRYCAGHPTAPKKCERCGKKKCPFIQAPGICQWSGAPELHNEDGDCHGSCSPKECQACGGSGYVPDTETTSTTKPCPSCCKACGQEVCTDYGNSPPHHHGKCPAQPPSEKPVCGECGKEKCVFWNEPGEHGSCAWPGVCHGGHPDKTEKKRCCDLYLEPCPLHTVPPATSPAEEWERDFRKLYRKYDMPKFPNGKMDYSSKYVEFIRSLLSQARKEGAREVVNALEKCGHKSEFEDALDAARQVVERLGEGK